MLKYVCVQAIVVEDLSKGISRYLVLSRYSLGLGS